MAKEERKQEEKTLDNIKDYSVPKESNSNNQIPEKVKQEMEKTRKDLEKLKKDIIKKYPFILALGIIPPQANEKFIDEEVEEEIGKDEMETRKKLVHLALIVPDEKIKEMGKIKLEIIQKIKETKQKIWLHTFTPAIIWEMCMDGKYELIEALAMSFPLQDKGLLGALRVSSIHKTLVLKKFEKYIVSYVIAGSLVRGEATKTSDVDVFIVIDDTDVKKMNRFELKEKLRSIIYSYVVEAGELAGVQNKLSPQVYILTEFWESVKDAHPVIFTFIRDGIPLYDRGTFMPWKLLLRMGKLKPSPEAIDMFMSMGDDVISRSKRIMLSEIFSNIFWGITTPAQALLMLNGCPPPNAKKELVRDFKKEFLDTKMIEKKYIDFIEKVVEIWRDYEHEKIKEISGKKIDELLEQTGDYMKRLKELREQIEKKTNEKTITQLYDNILTLLKNSLGETKEKKILEKFQEKIKQGIFPHVMERILKELIKAKSNIKKLTKHEVENVRKNSSILLNNLVEYSQRCELVKAERGRFKIKGKNKIHELLIVGEEAFLLNEKEILKIEKDKCKESSMEELSKKMVENKDAKEIKINKEIFEALKKQFGDYEIIL